LQCSRLRQTRRPRPQLQHTPRSSDLHILPNWPNTSTTS
jgi:hypothetical protein